MPHLTHLPSMIKEGRSWNPTEADEQETKPEKPGTPTIARFGSPVGLASLVQMRTSIASFVLHLQQHHL